MATVKMLGSLPTNFDLFILCLSMKQGELQHERQRNENYSTDSPQTPLRLL